MTTLPGFESGYSDSKHEKSKERKLRRHMNTAVNNTIGLTVLFAN